MTGTMADPAPESRNRHSAARDPSEKAISVAAKRLERDQQKWIPVLRPIALSNIENAHDLFAKPLTLWRVMG